MRPGTDCRPTRVAAVSCQELSPLLSQDGAVADMVEAGTKIARCHKAG